MRTIKGHDGPKVNHRKLEDYEIYNHYSVLNRCTDREGNRFNESTSRPIFAHHYNYTPRNRVMAISEVLLDQENQFTKDVASAIEHEPSKSFFPKSAEKIVNDYEVKVLGLKPRLGMET